ncbi:MAG: TolC family protein [Spirochaetaceae bacterium]
MKKVICLLFILQIINIYAEPIDISLDTALDMATRNNIDIKRAVLELEGKRRGKDTAYNVFFPTISGNTGLSRSNTEPLESTGMTDTNFFAGYTASFSFTPALFNAITLLKRDYELGEITYAKAIKSTETNVKEIFYNLILLKEQISLLEDNLKTIENRYEQMKINYSGGLVSELELLQLQVSFENFKPELNTVNNTYNSILLNFKTLLGIPLDQEISIIGEIEPEINELSAKDAFDLALLNNKDLQAVYKYKEIFEAQKKTKKAQNFLPIINISYSGSTMLNDPFEDDRFDLDNFTDDGGALQFSVVYYFNALFPNSKERMEIEAIDRSIEDTNLQNEALSDGLKLQITNYISILNNSVKIQEGLKLTVLLAKKSLGQVQQAYDAGTTQLIDVESAENEYKKSRLELLKEKFNYANNLIRLEAIILP